MALLIRLRQALFRSSSIPRCCSFSPIASDSSHLINLSKTLFHAASRLENPRIRPIPSRHDRRSPSTSLKNRFSFGPYYRKPETKIPNVEIDFPKSPELSSEEMIVTCFQTLAKVLGSVEDAKVIEKMFEKFNKSSLEMIEQLKGACMQGKRSVDDAMLIDKISDKFKKSGLEMINRLKGACLREKRSVKDIKMVEELSDKLTKSCLEIAEQARDMLGVVLLFSDLDIDREYYKSKEDKCGNEVTTSRLASPLTKYENQLSEDDLEMIYEIPDKLTKYVEVLENLKDCIEKAKATRTLRERFVISKALIESEMLECMEKKLSGFKVRYGDPRYIHGFDIDYFKELATESKAIRENIWRSRVYFFNKSEGFRNRLSKERYLRYFKGPWMELNSSTQQMCPAD